MLQAPQSWEEMQLLVEQRELRITELTEANVSLRSDRRIFSTMAISDRNRAVTAEEGHVKMTKVRLQLKRSIEKHTHLPACISFPSACTHQWMTGPWSLGEKVHENI